MLLRISSSCAIFVQIFTLFLLTQVEYMKLSYASFWCNVSNLNVTTGLISSSHLDQVQGKAEDWTDVQTNKSLTISNPKKLPEVSSIMM